MHVFLLQSQFVRADQEEQLPGLQSEPDQKVRVLLVPVPEAAAQGEHHTLRPQTSE